MGAKKDIGLAKRLKYLRAMAGLRQVEAAELIGVGYKSLQNHESGKRPNSSNLQRYVDYYGCDKNWLLTGIGDAIDAEKLQSKLHGIYSDPKDGDLVLVPREMVSRTKNSQQVTKNEERIDTNVLRQIIEAVEEALNERQLEALPHKKADFIAFLYDYFTETGKSVSKEKVERHLRLVA